MHKTTRNDDVCQGFYMDSIGWYAVPCKMANLALLDTQIFTNYTNQMDIIGKLQNKILIFSKRIQIYIWGILVLTYFRCMKPRPSYHNGFCVFRFPKGRTKRQSIIQQIFQY